MEDGLDLALRCLEAMEGQDTETKVSLWRAAVRYAARDRGLRDMEERSPRLRAHRGANLSGLARNCEG